MARTNAAAGWIGVVAAVLISGAACANGVDRRMAAAVEGSRELRSKAEALPPEVARQLGMEAVVEEDRAGEVQKRFARRSDVRAYLKLRPWSEAYRARYERPWPDVAVEAWPTEADLPSLRHAVEQGGDPAVRSIAVEALGAMGRVEDVERIGRLVDDPALGAPVLGWSRQMSSMGWFSQEADPIEPTRTWHDRTVGTYAREALKLMTGHRFDGKDRAGVTFAAWWTTHDLGKESLWYWAQRLKREADATLAMERKPGEENRAFYERWEAASAAHREQLHGRTMADLATLPHETQIKVFLLTGADGSGVAVDGPANEYFPEGLQVPISAGRLKDLIAGKDLWPDFADVPFGRAVMLGRLARVMNDVTAGYGDPMYFKKLLIGAIEKEAAGTRWRAILLSRLLPPRESEGYLRRELEAEAEGYTREMIAKEMVQADLAGQWPALETVFYTEKPHEGSDARIGILKGLGEAPHTKEKARRLVELIEDPRNEELFTQENVVMGRDQYRMWAMRGVEAIAGKDVVPSTVEEGLKQSGTKRGALAELRRIAREVAEGLK